MSNDCFIIAQEYEIIHIDQYIDSNSHIVQDNKRVSHSDI